MNYKLAILAPALALGGCVVAPPPQAGAPRMGCQMQGTAIACLQPDGTWNVAAAPPAQEAPPAPPQDEQPPPPPPPQYQYAPQPYPIYPPPPPPGYYGGGGYYNGY